MHLAHWLVSWLISPAHCTWEREMADPHKRRQQEMDVESAIPSRKLRDQCLCTQWIAAGATVLLRLWVKSQEIWADELTGEGKTWEQDYSACTDLREESEVLIGLLRRREIKTTIIKTPLTPLKTASSDSASRASDRFTLASEGGRYRIGPNPSHSIPLLLLLLFALP